MNFLKDYNTSFYKKSIIFLFVLWLLVQAFLIWYYGIVTNLEATKYIDEAHYFLQFGKFNTANHYLYATQIFLIAAVIKVHLGYSVIVTVQLLLNLLATWMFYQLAVSFLNNGIMALLATFLFIINIPYQQYTSFLFTESIFYSLTVIYSSYVLRLKRITPKDLLCIFLFLALLCITRPTGILFFIATVLFVFFRFLKALAPVYKIAIIAAFVLATFFILNNMLDAGGSLDFMLPFKKENIICGVNTVNDADIKTLEKGNSIQGLVYYIFNNEAQFLHLARLKTIAFFGMTRDYYSSLHNLWLMAFFYPLYLLSLAGIWKKIKEKNAGIIYMIAIILLYWVTTLLTCDDWHNRFMLTISPFIFLLAFAAFKNIRRADNK